MEHSLLGVKKGYCLLMSYTIWVSDSFLPRNVFLFCSSELLCRVGQVFSDFVLLAQTKYGIKGINHETSLKKFFIPFFFFPWPPYMACGISPDQGSNLSPLQWTCEILTPGPPEKSFIIFNWNMVDLQSFRCTSETPFLIKGDYC